MFFTILATSALDTSMAVIASFIATIVREPVSAAVRAWFARSFARDALSAVLRIMVDISSSAALVCTTEEPCSLQPVANAWLTLESWPEAVAVCAALLSREEDTDRRTRTVD